MTARGTTVRRPLHELALERARLAVRAAVRPRALAVVVAFAAILTVAVALRFHDLATNPGGLYADEAAEAFSAQQLLHWSGVPPVWFQADGGREALFAYLVATAFALFGQTVLVLRAVSAALGVAGVAAIALLGRRFGQGTALVASAWAGGSLWLVSVSRDGMRNMIVPVFGALAMAALLWWADRPSRRRAVAAGALLSIAALYTYQPLKLLPVLAAAWLLWLRRVDRARFDDLRRDLVPAAVAFAVVAVPMVLTAITLPLNYFGRIGWVTPFNPEVQAPDSPLVHVLRTLGMFTFLGDPNPRHDVDGIPLLGPVALAWIFFAIGCLGVVRLWRHRREPAHALVLIALPLFFLPPVPAVEGGSPHFLRVLGLAAPLAVTIGLGVTEVWERATRITPGSVGRLLRFAVPVAVVALLVAETVTTSAAYFSRPVADRYAAYDGPVVAMAGLAGPSDAVIAQVDPARTVLFLDAKHPPAVFEPGARIPDLERYARILATNRDDLRAAVGDEAASQAVPVAWDPSGGPAVWAVTP